MRTPGGAQPAKRLRLDLPDPLTRDPNSLPTSSSVNPPLLVALEIRERTASSNAVASGSHCRVAGSGNSNRRTLLGSGNSNEHLELQAIAQLLMQQGRKQFSVGSFRGPSPEHNDTPMLGDVLPMILAGVPSVEDRHTCL